MANKSARGPMAVDKSNTPAWVRITIIVVILAFVGISVPVVLLGAGKGSTSTNGTSGNSITDTYQPRVDSALAALESSPDNPDVIAQVGHAYYEWAVALFEAQQQSASIPIWLSAVSYYDKVLAIRPDDDIVLGNKAFALYYAGDAKASDALEAFIDSASDNAALAEQVTNAQGMLTQLQSSTATTTTP